MRCLIAAVPLLLIAQRGSNPVQSHDARHDVLGSGAAAAEPASSAASAAAETALIGVLPLALFGNGHVYWVQRAARARGASELPYALRPHLAPLAMAAPVESSALIRERLVHAGVWLRGGGDGGGDGDGGYVSEHALLLALRLPSVPSRPLSTSAGGMATLGAHTLAMAAQLHALRIGIHVAVLLGRSLVVRRAMLEAPRICPPRRGLRRRRVLTAVLGTCLQVPRLQCLCDRDPSGTSAELLARNCQLPSAEAEAYLPFECPAEQLLDLGAWREAAARDPAYTLLLAPAADAPTADAPPPVVKAATAAGGRLTSGTRPSIRVEALLGRAVDASSLATALAAQLPSPSSAGAKSAVVELLLPNATGTRSTVWDADLASMAGTGAWPHLADLSRRLPPSAKLPELDRLLSLGPVGGWCVPCSSGPMPGSLRQLADERSAFGSTPCRLCLNFTRLLLAL